MRETLRDKKGVTVMKGQHYDINVLLLSLLLFSIGLGIVYSSRSKENSQPYTNNNLTISTQDGLDLLGPFIIAVNIKDIITLLKRFPQETSFNIAKRIIEEKQSSLKSSDKQELIFGLAQALSQKQDTQYKFLDLLLELVESNKLPVLLIHAVKKGYDNLISDLITWAKSKEDTIPNLQDIAKKALFMAIDLQETKALEALEKSGISIDEQTATDLIWYAVSQNKNPTPIPFLIKLGAAYNKCKEGNTLLTKATAQNNLPMVKAIITGLQKKGIPQKDIETFINRFADPAIGSPLQIALEKKYVDIELYLRQQGGLEK